MDVNENGRIRKEVGLSHRCYYTIIFLEGLKKKTTKELTQDIQHPGRLLNPVLTTISSAKN
jgi:hypothetical protein